MKKNTKRFPAAMAAALFWLAACLPSCKPADGAEPPDPEIAAETTATEDDALAKLPGMDFGGEVFRVYFPNNPYSPKDKGFYAETSNGEKFNDAVFNRNAFVEDRYNVRIEGRYGADWDSMYGDLKRDVGSGEASCDVYFSHIRAGVTGALADGLVRAWNDVPHVRFGEPWWNQSIIETLSIGDRIFFAYGSASVHDVHILTFNKAMLKNNNLEDPYALVRGGKWTIDKLGEISKSVTRDLDGDGRFTVEDQYGLEFGIGWQVPVLMYSLGGMAFTKDGEGKPEFNLGSEQMKGIYEKIYALFYEGPPAYLYSGTTTETTNMPHIGIGSGRVLFCHYNIAMAETLRDVEVDYGILPMPKRDEQQKDYAAISFTGMYCLPATATEGELQKAGLVMEAICALGHRDVLPIYHDEVLKIKTARDDESSEMLDIIFSNIVFDVAHNYDILGISNFFGELIQKRSANYASEVERIEESVKSRFDKFYGDVMKIS